MDGETKGSPWDVFIHLLAVIALYASVYATIALLFQYINLTLPDPTDNRIDVRDWIRYNLAVLVIFFPAYVWAWRSIEIDLAANPGKRRLWVRTCPIYLTLFLSGLLALGDLSCLTYYFLTGDLTSRFILKILAILAVTGAVLLFYLNALRREPGPLPRRTRLSAYSASAAAIAIAIAGFATAGSPAHARLTHLDSKRIENLASIQEKISEYWERRGNLPPSLDELADNISGYSPPRDPVNGRPYDYRPTNNVSFELCADFALKNFDTAYTLPPWISNRDGGPNTTWNHDAGHVCFSRKIDPSRYRPKSDPRAPH